MDKAHIASTHPNPLNFIHPSDSAPYDDHLHHPYEHVHRDFLPCWIGKGVYLQTKYRGADHQKIILFSALLADYSRRPTPKHPDISEWEACTSLGMLILLWVVYQVLECSCILLAYSGRCSDRIAKCVISQTLDPLSQGVDALSEQWNSPCAVSNLYGSSPATVTYTMITIPVELTPRTFGGSLLGWSFGTSTPVLDGSYSDAF